MKVRVKKTGEVLLVHESAKIEMETLIGGIRSYRLDEIEIIPDEPKKVEAPAIDWEQRRYEIAKELLVQRINRKVEQMDALIQHTTESDAKDIVKLMSEALIKSSVIYADELIKQLQAQ